MNLNKFFILLSILIGISACTKDVSVSSPESESLKKNKIFITSVPSNAKIYNNHKYTGYNTPDTVKFLEPGVVQIALKLKYFNDYEVKVETGDEVVPEINLDFYELPDVKGSVKIKSIPNNIILEIDDSTIVHNSGEILEMYPGEYSATFRANGHRSMSRKIEVYSQTEKIYSVELIDTSDILIYDKNNYNFVSNNISLLEMDYNHTCWFVSNNRIGYIENEKINYIDENLFSTSGAIFYDIFVSSDNTKWFATSQGIISLKDNIVNFFDETSGITSGRINSLNEDSSGKIWYTGDNGFGYMESEKVKNYNNTHLGLPDEVNFYSIEFSNNGELLIGTTNYFVIWKNFTEVVVYEPIKEIEQQPYNVYVSDVLIDLNNKIWITVTTDEVEFFDKIYLLKSNIFELKVQSARKFSNIEVIRNNQLVCGGAYLMKTFNETKLKSSLLSDYLPGGLNLNINNLALAKKRDEIWLATNYGIVKVKTTIINKWCDD